MTKRNTRIATMTLVLLAGAGASFAQAPATALVDVSGKTMVPGFNVTADDLESMNVYNAAGQKIGEIEDVVGSDKMTPTGVAIDFERSANLGREHRVVALDKVKQNGLRLVVDIDSAAAAQLPVYND
ncbi:PRC-barrel domain protein [Rhizobium sp. PP-F2F-G38]|uniref:PRC-barrel domain containing protein n=1 Tax=Ferranicluibacter rubi TaxID=2715133 RepID=A0AA43ZCW7_9HYPH|nr:PRC-barrel domain-containing protein [Ferranicluibacter rubi]PYE33945.1 PRC-barrel domain protein [Rhizobium sp. PP-WC-1G-195]PYE94468.1 PRC-barrel domain protein [Rhizobium sp. PP-F2F-G38]TCP80369.1 PRC-barrel domain protein [Rhizobium sp. PP-CC-2G-626]TCQ23731.1 PRC-barrel domain protein [Rhizobium sp. PP-CC-3G-465]NHT75508.1 PRC-barrel domain containing protein [Ferranicluibacter rubi]